MAHRQPIQLFPVLAPLRHQSIHQRYEAVVVGSFAQVRHLVDNDVFEAFAWLLGQGNDIIPIPGTTKIKVRNIVVLLLLRVFLPHHG